jgi:predicted HTH transcriptional regulator
MCFFATFASITFYPMENTDLIIKNLLQQTESDRIEVGTKIPLDAIAISVTEFINGDGGDMLLGVDENRKVVGVINAQQYRNEIRDYLSKKIVPVPPVSINLFIFHLKPLIVIHAWEGADKPYSYNQQIYHREKPAETGEEIPEESESNFETVSKGVESELKQIYMYIKEIGTANTSDLVTLTNKSLATVKRYLKILKARKMIHFIGSRNHKIGGYKVIDVES